jgi:hypothetical protein
MMTRCREMAGILFKRKCEQQSVAQCAQCHKPVCNQHVKQSAAGPSCVTCVRNQLQDRSKRGNYSHLRDDPYFYWYFYDDFDNDPYDAGDYSVFDSGSSSSDYDGSFDNSWEGS